MTIYHLLGNNTNYQSKECTTNLHFEFSNIVFIIGFSRFNGFLGPTCRINPCNPLNPMTNILIMWKFVVYPIKMRLINLCVSL